MRPDNKPNCHDKLPLRQKIPIGRQVDQDGPVRLQPEPDDGQGRRNAAKLLSVQRLSCLGVEQEAVAVQPANHAVAIVLSLLLTSRWETRLRRLGSADLSFLQAWVALGRVHSIFRWHFILRAHGSAAFCMSGVTETTFF